MVEEGQERGNHANVRAAGNPARLLPGERPESRHSEDADHWVRVYRELLAFNLEMMDRIGHPPDRLLVRAHYRRHRSRLRYWERRLAELTPNGASQTNGSKAPAD